MKCSRCGAKNEIKAKYCSECGTDLVAGTAPQPVTVISELYGKEIEVLFFIESFTGKISGIVNPSEDQIGRYREGIIQKVTIETPVATDTDENVGALLTFIRQSKEYLGEKYDESSFRNSSTVELKKEYLKLFEKILRVKSKNMDAKPPMPVIPEKK
jgi:hypothetical protein